MIGVEQFYLSRPYANMANLRLTYENIIQWYLQINWLGLSFSAIVPFQKSVAAPARSLVRIAFISILATAWLSCVSPALADSDLQPKTCRIGSYVTSLSELNLSKRSFGTEFWMWSICPSKELQPLKSMEIVNAISTEISSESELKRKDKIGEFQQQPEVYWSQQKVKATILYDWNVQNYPFDRHVLEIPIEESTYDTNSFVYTPDLTNSTYKRDMHLDGWRITDFQIKQSKTTYESTFGDPELTSGKSAYTGLVIALSIRRQSILNFFKVAAGVYAAALICLLSFFFNTAENGFMTSRISMLSGAMFATLVNMRGVEAVLGSTEQVTLLDKIHILTLVYILAASLATIVSRLIADAKSHKASAQFNRKLFFVFSISFVITNACLILNATNIG